MLANVYYGGNVEYITENKREMLRKFPSLMTAFCRPEPAELQKVQMNVYDVVAAAADHPQVSEDAAVPQVFQLSR